MNWVFIWRLIAIIGGIAILAVVHEFGHFIAARLSKVKVTDFFIGFGPKLFSVKRGETTYGIAAIPAGAYVKMAGDNLLDEEGDEKQVDDSRSLPKASFIKKLFIVVLGPVANLLLAFLILSVAFGFEGEIKPTNVVAATVKNSPAEGSLKKGDRIVGINGHKTTTWNSLSKEIKKHPKQIIEATFIRRGQKQTVKIKTIIKQNVAMIGIYPFEKRIRFLSLSESLKVSAGFIFAATKAISGLIFKALTGQPAELAKSSMSIVGFVNFGVKISTTLLNFLFLIGYLSFILAYFNLLPLPPLDGGRMLLFVIEKIKKSPIKKNAMIAINAVGFSILLTLFVYLLVKDLIFGLPNV